MVNLTLLVVALPALVVVFAAMVVEIPVNVVVSSIYAVDLRTNAAANVDCGDNARRTAPHFADF